MFSISRLAAALALVCAAPSASMATTVDFFDLGDFQTPALALSGVTVTGSSTISVNQFNGLGIVGGLSDGDVDSTGNEWIHVDVGTVAGSLSYSFTTLGNGNPSSGTGGDHTLEAFGQGGVSLGQVTLLGPAIVNVPTLFGGAPVEAFRLVPIDGDWFSLRTVSFTPVPEPTTALLIGVGFILLAGTSRRPPTD